MSVVPVPRLSPEERHGDCVRIAFMLDLDALTRGVERLAETWERVREAPGARAAESASSVFV